MIVSVVASVVLGLVGVAGLVALAVIYVELGE